jgi:HSP20 family protein
MGLGLESSGALPPGAWLPPMDVIEEDDHFQFLVELPGVEANQIRCTIRDGVLEISGNRVQPLSEGESFRRMERIYGPFRRTVELKQPVDEAGLTTVFEQGVFKVTVPRTGDAG